MNIAAAIQSQMLETLLAALRPTEFAPKPGDTVAARFLGWASAPPQNTEPAAARIQVGAQMLTLVVASGDARRALLQPGAALTLAIDEAPSGEPARARLLAIGDSPAAREQPSMARRPDLPPTPAPAVLSADQARAAAGPLVGAALARQDGLGPLFADLDALVAARAPVPDGVARAAAALLGMRLTVSGGDVGPDALRQAVSGSGLFHEALQAAGDPAASGDLKAALIALRAALRAALGPDAPTAGQAALKPPREAEGLEPRPATAARPLAPMRDGLPAPQPEAQPRIDPIRQEPAAMLSRLLGDTEAALDRLTLGQYASLPDQAAAGPLNRWFAELPLMADGRNLVLPLEIEEDEPRPGSTPMAARLWRVRFALDVEPIGPVHALVTLQGRTVGVSVWAEREGAARLIRDFAPELEAALVAGDFERADIDVLAGKPQARAPGAGQYLDRRS